MPLNKIYIYYNCHDLLSRIIIYNLGACVNFRNNKTTFFRNMNNWVAKQPLHSATVEYISSAE